jgi:hypothetical protein
LRGFWRSLSTFGFEIRIALIREQNITEIRELVNHDGFDVLIIVEERLGSNSADEGSVKLKGRNFQNHGEVSTEMLSRPRLQ